MESIGINEVLAKMSDTVDLNTADVKIFSIRCYTREGYLREFRVRKYTRAPRQTKGVEQERGKAAHSLKEKGLVMLQDVGNGRIIDVRVATIYGFRDHNSTVWTKVYH